MTTACIAKRTAGLTAGRTGFAAHLEQDPAREKVYGCFGDTTVLVPVKTLNQLPTESDWGKLTLEKTFASAYQNLLWESSLAVLCGPASGNLAAITFLTSADLQVFLADNPALQTSLITGNSAGTTVWCRINDLCPANHTAAGMTWTSIGVIPVYSRRGNAPFTPIKDGHPVAINFTSIKWSPALADTFRLDLSQQRCRMVVEGKQTFSPCFAAHYYAYASNIAYDPDTSTFFRPEGPSNLRRNINPTVVMAEIADCLRKLTPTALAMGVTINIGVTLLRAILNELKFVALKQSPREQDGLETFVSTAIVRQAGADVTVGELLTAYVAFCKAHGFPAYTDTEFTNLITPLIKEIHRTSKSNDVVRNGTSRRGFHNLQLKVASI